MDNLLVSICVITYNSSKYILETLDSIYRQTYDNIELIVSDDCSVDDTISLVKEWIKVHENRFSRALLLTVEKNTGTAANCNRGLFVSAGIWFKPIAGDDILMDDGIEKLLSYAEKNERAKWIFANSIFFKKRIEENCIVDNIYEKMKEVYNASAQEQLKKVLIGNPFVGPGHFLKRDLLQRVGGFDEEFGILEDYPLWIKILSLGEKSYYLDDYVAGYRVRTDDNVGASGQKLVNRNLAKLAYKVGQKLVFGKFPLRYEWNFRLKYYLKVLFSCGLLNHRNSLNSTIYSFFYNSINHFLR